MKLPWQKNESGVQELELPDELVTSIKAGAEAKEGLSRIEKMLKDQADVQAKKDADDKAAKEAAELTRRKKELETQNDTLEEQVEQLMLEGRTKDAINLVTQGTTAAVLEVKADNARRELFEDAEKFPYYNGDIKRKVDSLLASQALQFRVNPANIENCYHTVLGKHTKELVEGKLKSRFAGGSGSSNAGNTGGAGDDGAPKGKVDDEIRKIAKQFGMSGEDYAKMLEADGIGY
ncbi:MAG: hypothetical protein P4L77_11960 [Sulfuriferula sp.]|nr:hypothetical protein [Sulfuriferula sp.]